MDSASARAVAIIGVAGRFPGTSSLDDLWVALRDRRDLLSRLSEADLIAEGIPADVFNRPSYVRAGYVLPGMELFDADYFGFTARDAAMTDPQLRLMLECAVQALEDAGYDPARHPGPIGMFAGSSLSSYLGLLSQQAATAFNLEQLQIVLSNDKDHLCTRVAHKLDLRGPCVTIQTACSTALVSVHMACQSLLAGDCDIALAGGVTARVPERMGYLSQPGLSSSDGRCRTFDARCEGTVFSSGIGLVVLKPLDDALADRDNIRAVILGSAINNDGATRASYAAPAKDGQRRAVEEAIAVAGVSADTIGYVEAHGTATPLGDPLEIRALTEAFSSSTARKQFCAIGSIKSNLGHLESAAGIAGLIKTTLVLQHGEIPPILHFERPNPAIHFEETPFFPVIEPIAWPRGQSPRRAGVSSFGMGGTNAHVVVEEAPPPAAASPSRRFAIVPLSARTESALGTVANELGARLRARPEIDLPDCAYTLALGRAEHPRRRVVVCDDRGAAIAALAGERPEIVLSGTAEPRQLVYLLPGQGSQHADMAAGLYATEPVFREVFDRCCAVVAKDAGVQLTDAIFVNGGSREARDRDLSNTALAQPALFAVEIALARLWESWGVSPRICLGHSLGEYVAACLSGTFTLEGALGLVIQRGRLIQELPQGAMLAIDLSDADVETFLQPDVDLAAVNGPRQCVLSGPAPAIEAVAARLNAAGVRWRSLPVSHAFHSGMMDPILRRFEAHVRRVDLRPPARSFISNLTGAPITGAEATSAEYWVRHLRGTVRFADGIRHVLSDPAAVMLEVGPGRALSALARQCDPERQPIASLRHPQESRSDEESTSRALGQLWALGVPIDWNGFYAAETRRRVPLPTYPFERKLYSPNRAAASRPIDGHQPALASRPVLSGASAPDDEALARAWRELFGVSEISPVANFFDMGGTSLLASELLARVRAEFDVVIPMERLFKAPRLMDFTREVTALRAGGRGEDARASEGERPDFAADIQLDADIVASGSARSGAPAKVLLTGATGFLGAFLLRSLLRHTRAEIICLVRARDERAALRRIIDNQKAYGTWEESAQARIRPELGDLALPRLGLSDERFQRLAEEVDDVVHCGAFVNFIYPYQALRAANVVALKDVLRLATARRLKPVQLISTAALFYNERYPRTPAVREDDPLIHNDLLRAGYHQSKWVAEKIVQIGRERGIPINVFRPGTIAGDSRTGAFNKSDFVIRLIKSCVQLGLAPETDTLLYMSPADVVSDAVVAIALNEEVRNRSFHLVPEAPLTGEELFAHMRVLGYPLRRCKYSEWFDALLESTKHSQENALAPFIPFLTDNLGETAPLLDSTNTRAALEGSPVRIPTLTRELLEVYFKYFLESGFIEQGEHELAS